MSSITEGPYGEAGRRITVAARNHTTSLDLSGLGLVALPDALGQLTALTRPRGVRRTDPTLGLGCGPAVQVHPEARRLMVRQQRAERDQDALADASVRTSAWIPMLRFGAGIETDVQAFTFTGLIDGQEHLALGLGSYREASLPLVRVHSECLTGDVFGSARCDCGPQLQDALQHISRAGGYLLYLRQEGRGIGLYNKLDAYALQDQGLDTFQANEALGFASDGRDYTAAAQILRALGVPEIRLLSNNPDKQAQLARHGIIVRELVPTGVFATAANLRYLHAKVEIAGHRMALAQPHGEGDREGAGDAKSESGDRS